MAVDPKNMIMLTGGVVSDIETITTKSSLKIYKLRLGVDRAGQDNNQTGSGYFNVTYFVNENDSNSNFIHTQIENGNLKKGSQLQVVGRLIHERWERDGKKGQTVSIIAEAMTYAGSASKPAENSDKASVSDPEANSVLVDAVMPASW